MLAKQQRVCEVMLKVRGGLVSKDALTLQCGLLLMLAGLPSPWHGLTQVERNRLAPSTFNHALCLIWGCEYIVCRCLVCDFGGWRELGGWTPHPKALCMVHAFMQLANLAHFPSSPRTCGAADQDRGTQHPWLSFPSRF
jgi:hypothetical protein